MDFEQELKRLAKLYTDQGYQVTLRPQSAELPSFAKDFQVEMVARRGGEGVLVAVKKNRDELAVDQARYAEITGAQPGWRFDLAIVEAESPMGRAPQGARDFSGDEIVQSLADAEQMARMGFVRPAVITAWGGLEAAMRMRLRADGRKAGWGTMPREMLNELYSSGVLSRDEFRQLERLSQLRNEIAHGFASSTQDAEAVQLLTEIARRLLEESQAEKQTA